ncbi:hypothetical protein ASD16_15765 [Cellulomonas sp. Root485]|nr:hypothetical protein ASD16_15765 [Cellulomonas sp. Root485]
MVDVGPLTHRNLRAHPRPLVHCVPMPHGESSTGPRGLARARDGRGRGVTMLISAGTLAHPVS